MERTQVRSSAVISLGHEGETLEVEYRNGALFAYDGITADEYALLLTSESIGSQLQKLLRVKNCAGRRMASAPPPVTTEDQA